MQAFCLAVCVLLYWLYCSSFVGHFPCHFPCPLFNPVYVNSYLCFIHLYCVPTLWSCPVTLYDCPVGWPCSMTMCGDPVWSPCLTVLYDGWPFAVTLCHDCGMDLWDDCVWWPCAVTLSDDHVWSRCVMDDPLRAMTLCHDSLCWTVWWPCMSSGLGLCFSACLCCLCHCYVSVSAASVVSAAHSLISNSLCFCQLDFTLKLMDLVLCQAFSCILEFMHLAKYSLGS